eukprot:CAMPEP_0117030854 /NCGR_PEP_ID=MMETSP0472-20121206/22237_1 /TAXON_ID=693140 ORGANISM="Tiarina fusus, Strain LIS" /NCGR_SAMPLE_ID=MMETSP0472 /ASSEMBLY_ACC=CAM_ASM_000603 /LENGTH=98 /DNA_ID=CAMNT_0004739045 /DNA_START=471 /DNA_END=767 /DNA_ORIENTATION=+
MGVTNSSECQNPTKTENTSGTEEETAEETTGISTFSIVLLVGLGLGCVVLIIGVVAILFLVKKRISGGQAAFDINGDNDIDVALDDVLGGDEDEEVII